MAFEDTNVKNRAEIANLVDSVDEQPTTVDNSYMWEKCMTIEAPEAVTFIKEERARQDAALAKQHAIYDLMIEDEPQDPKAVHEVTIDRKVQPTLSAKPKEKRRISATLDMRFHRDENTRYQATRVCTGTVEELTVTRRAKIVPGQTAKEWYSKPIVSYSAEPTPWLQQTYIALRQDLAKAKTALSSLVNRARNLLESYMPSTRQYAHVRGK